MLTSKEVKRIFTKIILDPETKCWNWTGALDNGYGRIYWRGKRYKAHRFIYLWHYKTLPNWSNKSCQEIDHICNNRKCVNPDHLRLTTPKVNVLRGNGPTAINAKKTTCKHGHPLVSDNRGGRKCTTCNRLYMSSDKRRAYKRKYYNEHYKVSKSP